MCVCVGVFACLCVIDDGLAAPMLVLELVLVLMLVRVLVLVRFVVPANYHIASSSQLVCATCIIRLGCFAFRRSSAAATSQPPASPALSHPASSACPD
jgi:hypothetical protein